MPTLNDIFRKSNIILYQNESLDLDHYYQEPYQDNNELTNDSFDMSEPFENGNTQKKKRHIDIEFDRRGISNFSFFMDGSRRTYKIGDIVLDGKRIFPVVVAQVRAGSAQRGADRKLSKYSIIQKNLLLISSAINEVDFEEIRQRIIRCSLAKKMNLEVCQYKFDKQKDLIPVNAAIGKANSFMHNMEIEILQQMVHSNVLQPNKMLIVDGPLQFITQDTGKDSFADLFYNVVGVSKSFDPMLPISEKTRGGTQIGTQLLQLEYGDRTPVFYKQNSRGRKFGCWYLRIRPRKHVHNPLEGIIKVEKMAVREDLENEGLDTDIVDNLSLSLLEEGAPTCHGKDERWASHLYPIYLTETMIKSSFLSDLSFVNFFKRDFI